MIEENPKTEGSKCLKSETYSPSAKILIFVIFVNDFKITKKFSQ